MPQDFLQFTGIFALFALMIRELFAYLKSRKGNGGGNNLNEAILKELQTMNQNHLHELKDAINAGNDRVVDAINSGNIKQVELLGRIEGKLDRR